MDKNGRMAKQSFEEKMNGRGSINVQDILDNYSNFGIPHFQRGLVWNDEMVSLLFESLYTNYPCGSFIFWGTNSSLQYGIPCNGDGSLKWLIIDGQQRINAIHDVLNANSDDEEIWCINANKAKLLPKQHENSMPAREIPFLRRIRRNYWKELIKKQEECKHSGDKRPPLFAHRNFIPVCLLFNRDILLEKDISGAMGKDAFNANIEVLNNVLSKILGRSFFAFILEDTPSSEAYDIYIRVNSSGKRVDLEEKAFAQLVNLEQQKEGGGNMPTLIEQAIYNMFCGIHGKLGRREYLSRKKESHLGFKYFIRVFVFVCTIQFGKGLRNNFSFDLLLKPKSDFVRKYKTLLSTEKDRISDIWKATEDIVLYLANNEEYNKKSPKGILYSPLHSNNFSFVPANISLNWYPILYLLSLYKKELITEKKQGNKVAYLCLKLSLINFTQQHIIEILAKLEAAGNGSDINRLIDIIEEQANNVLKEEIRRYSGKEPSVDKLLVEYLKLKFKESMSPQSSFILLLYWLLRHRKSTDFIYDNVQYSQNYTCDTIIGETEDTNFLPEKQHIIPLSKLKEIGIGAGRGKSDATNIGNITYISHALNGGTEGLWQKFFDIDKETSHNNNLKSHFFGSNEIIEEYKKIKDYFDPDIKTKETPEQIKARFQSFCGKRRDLIAEGFQEWLNELKK